MGWANCGEDSQGRHIGYAHEGTCDHPGCDAEIDRGLSYACGSMHGQLEIGCEGYYCPDHMHIVEIDGSDHIRQLCTNCYTPLQAFENDDGVIHIPDGWQAP